jgi:hypothetical protein
MKLNSITLQAVGPLAAAALIATTLFAAPTYAGTTVHNTTYTCNAEPGGTCDQRNVQNENITVEVEYAERVCNAEDGGACDLRQQRFYR